VRAPDDAAFLEELRRQVLASPFRSLLINVNGFRERSPCNVALFDFGILSSMLHGLVMVPQAFFYPNEHAHMWSDVPVLFAMAVVLWIWYPERKGQA